MASSRIEANASSSAADQSIAALVGLLKHSGAAFARAFELAVDGEAFGQRQQIAIERGEAFEWHAGLRAARGAARRRLRESAARSLASGLSSA